MNAMIMAVVILLPILGGALVPLLPLKKRIWMEFYVEGLVVLNSILVILMLLHRPQESFVLFELTGDLSISFRLDGLGTVFAGIVSSLWPFATLYAFEYMKHERHEKIFFLFYTITYGVVLGIG